MADVDSDYDEEAHQKLLKSVQQIGNIGPKKPKRPLVKKKLNEISANELVDAIHSTRNLDDLKKELQKKKTKKRSTKKKIASDKSTETPTTLPTPLHRLATERIESKVAYSEARKELSVWSSVVQENRLADQLVFPLEKEEFIDQTGVQQFQDLKPRTALEQKMAEILGTSKNNLHNDQSYTEAEMELLKAMSLKEAKAKCAHLQKMRALVSYRESKLRRQAKIKSKSYHRHLKRQKRKQLIKEFDELLVKDPEAAQEKLAEIERQRILERATLKHRNGSKRIQMLARHASKDTNAKRAIEEQIRLGRELTEKYTVRNGSGSEDSDGEGDALSALKPQELLERAAEIASRQEEALLLETSVTNPALKRSLHESRQQQKQLSAKSAANASRALVEGSQTLPTVVDEHMEANGNEEKIWPEDTVWESVDRSSETLEVDNVEQSNEKSSIETVPSSVKRKAQNSETKKKKRKKQEVDATSADVDKLFESTEQRLIETTTKEAEHIRLAEEKEAKDAEFKGGERTSGLVGNDDLEFLDSAGNISDAAGKRKQNEKDDENEQKATVQEVDISMDPKHFLKVETNAIVQLSADLMDRVDDFDAETEQEALVAAAFEDDDVIGDFEAEKAAVEQAEKPKDLDLNLQGWGSWAGPGITPKKKDRFIIKAKSKKRKDCGRHGVIISETVDSSIDKIQPRSVPFPYTTVEDYEAVVRQPLGKEWNPQRIHQKLVKPAVITRAGRIIKPLDKEVALKEHVKEVSDDEDN